MNDGVKPHVQHFAEGFGEIDPMQAADAEAAAAAVSARYEGLIREVVENSALSPERKAADISGLRYRQRAESAAVSAGIMAAAIGAAAARREAMRLSRARPATQQEDPELGGGAQLVDRSGPSQDSGSRPAPGAIALLFRAAAKGVSQRAQSPQPKAKRRSGGDARGAFGMAAKPTLCRAATGQKQSYAAAAAFLSDTLDWLNLWQDNLDYGNELDVSNTEQNYLSPHL